MSPSTVDDEPSSLSDALETLRLRCGAQGAQSLENVKEALKDIVSTRICNVVSAGIDSDEEARMWEAFAEVYCSEVQAYAKRKGKQPSMARKRQIFADILVWAEVTRPGYDSQAAAFVTETHVKDEHFQRIGKNLASAKVAKGLTKV